MDEKLLTALIGEELAGESLGASRRHHWIIEHLEGSEVFAEGITRYALTMSGFRLFEPRNAAALAVEVARSRESAAAGARWLQKVLSSTSAEVRLILEVGGIEVTGPDMTIGDMTLTAGDRLPPSPFTERMIAKAASDSAFQSGVAYIYRTIERTDLWDTKRPRRDLAPDPFEPLRTLAARLAIIGDASPAILRVWSEHLDPDLDACFGTKGWIQPGQDAATPWFPEEVTPDHQPILDRLYALTGPLSKVFDIALRRINLGRRRVSPGDTAIDAAIALEALLGDPNSSADMTYKLRLRCALFLADTLEGRRAISEEVKALYALRSRVAHGGEPKPGAHAVAERGVQIVREVLHKLLEHPVMPNWGEWELAGGNPLSTADPAAAGGSAAPAA